MAMSITQLANLIPTEADAYRFLEDQRWGDRPVCPDCGSVGKHYFLTPRNGKPVRKPERAPESPESDEKPDE
jgi:Transposase zinc-ribbon domain